MSDRGSRAGLGETGVVGEDDGVDAISQIELERDPFDVRLDGGSSITSVAAIPRLVCPLAMSSSTSRSRGVSSANWWVDCGVDVG